MKGQNTSFLENFFITVINLIAISIDNSKILIIDFDGWDYVSIFILFQQDVHQRIYKNIKFLSAIFLIAPCFKENLLIYTHMSIKKKKKMQIVIF